MSLLLDTHALLWWLEEAPMQAGVEDQIADPAVLVAVSAASIWEIAIKEASGKLRVDGSIIEHVERGGFAPVLISYRHAQLAGGLPLHHGDPFDRMLIAQAIAERLTIVTRDAAFDAYDVPVLRC